jgi:hypothetical protein
MATRVKVLGFALAAAAAMSVVTTTAVQAFQLHATSNADVVITGAATTQQVLINPSGILKCTNLQFEGKISYVSGQQVTANELTITPTYSGCTALIGLAATVQMNGCKYTVTDSQANPLTGLVDITGCTEGKKITVSAGLGGCMTTIGEQSNLSHVTFADVAGNPHHVTDSFTVTGIAYEMHGVLCGHPTTVVTNNSSYSGGTTLKAYKKTGNTWRPSTATNSPNKHTAMSRSAF